MPFLAPVFAAVGGAFTAASAGVSGLLASTALTTGFGAIAFKAFTQIAGGLILGAISRALTPKPKEVQSGTRLSLTFGETNAQTFILGFAGTPGELLYHNSWGLVNDTPNEFYVQVIELSDLPARTDRVWINGEWVTLKQTQTSVHPSLHLVGYAVNGYEKDGSDRLWVKFYDGTQVAADPYLVQVFGDDDDRPWTSEMVGLGMAYAIVTADVRKSVNRQRPVCKFEVSAWGHYDRRKDSSAGGVGAQRWDNWRTWQPSLNPMVHVDNIMRGIRDPITGEFIWGGQGAANFNMPASAWFAAMNACDEVRTTSAGTEPEYRTGLEVLVSDEPAGVLEELLKSCVGQIAETAGQWHVKVGPPGPAVYDFTDNDVVLTTPDTFKPIKPLDGIYNGISGAYVDPAAGWVAKDAPLRLNATYLDDDRGRQNIAGITYPAVPFPRQVQRLMLRALNDDRRQRTHAMALPPECCALGPLDDVTYTSVENGYISKKFDLELVEDLPDGNVAIAMRERDPADYDYQISDELPTSIGYRPTKPRPIQYVDFTVQPWTIADDQGRPRAPAIRLNWTVRPGIEAIAYMVRDETTGDLIQTDGRSSKKPTALQTLEIIANGLPVLVNDEPMVYMIINNVASGYAIIAGRAIRPNTMYGVNAMYLPEEGHDWLPTWLLVETPNVKLIRDDFDDVVNDEIDQARDDAQTAKDQALAALNKANQVEVTLSGLSAELIADIEAVVAQLEGIAIGDIQEIRGIGMAGLRRGGWAYDPTLSIWTAPGPTSSPMHFTTVGFAAYAVLQADAENAPFPNSTLVNVPAGSATGAVTLLCESHIAGQTKAADPKADYAILEVLLRVNSGELNDCRLRIEWRNSSTGIWTPGHAFGTNNCPGRLADDWGFAVDADRVQSHVVVWQRPVTANAVRIQFIVKPVGGIRATQVRIDYLNFGAASAADVKAMLANGYADAAISAYNIVITGPNGAIAAMGDAVRTEFGDADAAITNSIVALTSDVESIAGTLLTVESRFGGTNLVHNSQFRDGVRGPGIAPVDWSDWDATMTVVQKTAPGVGAVGLQNAPTKYVGVFPADVANHDVRAHAPHPIAVGDHVEASAMFSASGVAINKTVTLWVRYFDTDGGTHSNVVPSGFVLSGNAWRTFTPEVFPPAPAGAASFSLYVRDTAGGSASQVFFTNVSSRIVDNASYSSAQLALATSNDATEAVATIDLAVSAEFEDMDAMVSATATAFASANAAQSAFVIRFLNGAFKAVGWNDTTGSGSAIVLEADNIIAPGSLAAGSLVIADLGYNMVPDDQLQSRLAWGTGNGFSIVPVAANENADSIGELRWIEGATLPVSCAGLRFPVRSNKRLRCGWQAQRLGGTRMVVQAKLQWFDKAGNLLSPQSTIIAQIDTTQLTLQTISLQIVSPTDAKQARFVWDVLPGTNGPVRFYSPSVIHNEDASVLITPDGAFFEMLRAETAWIVRANIGTAVIGTLEIEDGAISSSTAGVRSANLQVSPDNTFLTVTSEAITKVADRAVFLFAKCKRLQRNTYRWSGQFGFIDQNGLEEWRILRGATVIASSDGTPDAFNVDISSVAGAFTYSLQVRSSPGTGPPNAPNLVGKLQNLIIDEAVLGIQQFKR